LPGIVCPTLVIVGEHDIGTPLTAALDLHRGIPRSTLAVIADAAHMTCIEQPDRFNRVLRMCLDSTASESTLTPANALGD
jgi:3-oxoadipate enol-lactonase